MQKDCQYSFSKKKKILHTWHEHCWKLARLVYNAHKSSGVEYKYLLNALDEHEQEEVLWMLKEIGNERTGNTTHQSWDYESKL